MSSAADLEHFEKQLAIDTAFDVKYAGGPKSTATNVWGGNGLTLAMVKALASRRCLAGKTAIGLGSGLGVLDMVVAAGGAHMLATDLAEVLPVLRRNIQANAGLLDSVHGAGGLRPAVLDWTAPLPPDIVHAGPFDLVFASDCVYWPELFQPLVATLSALSDLSFTYPAPAGASSAAAASPADPADAWDLSTSSRPHPAPHVFLAMESRKPSELHFFSLLDAAGFRWYRVDDLPQGHEGLARSSGQSVGMFWCQKVGPRGRSGTGVPRPLGAADGAASTAAAAAHASSAAVPSTVGATAGASTAAAAAATDVDAAAQTVWAYHTMRQPLQRCDLILVLCSNDPRVAEYGARLWLRGLAPTVMFTGGVGALTEGLYGGLSEGEFFARIACRMGVPASAIIVEGRSTNTGENIRFSAELVVQERARRAEAASASSAASPTPDPLWPRRLLLVQKPFMERRSFATFEAQGLGVPGWEGVSAPGGRVTVTSPPISWQEYPQAGLPGLDKQGVIEVMCGDLQRIAVYPFKSFQSRQAIPRRVWQALRTLVAAGFTRHLVKLPARPEEGPQQQQRYEGLEADGPEPDCVVDDGGQAA